MSPAHMLSRSSQLIAHERVWLIVMNSAVQRKNHSEMKHKERCSLSGTIIRQ